MTDDLHHLAAAYAVDALHDDERAAFETHLARCEVCSREIAELQATAAALADGVATAPPPSLRSEVMRRITETRQVPPSIPTDGATTADADPPATPTIDDLAARRRARSSWRTSLAAAAALAIVAVGAVLIAGRAGGDELADVVAAPDALVTQLEGETGSIRVVWSPQRDQVAVFADGLPDPGDDRVYELWAISGGVPTPAGLFTPDGGTARTLISVDDLDVEAWGVTIEPAGGSPAPTGDILHFAATA